jgi:hypothetical protein
MHRRHTLTALTLCCAGVHAAVLAVMTAPPPPQAAAATALSVRSIEVAAPATLPATLPNAQVAPAPARKPTAVPQVAPVQTDALAPTHLAAEGLDMPPMPRSAPDAAMVEDVGHSGMPIRLRLYVEADGTVSDIELQFALDEDEPAAQALADMFRATGFLPGRLHGRDVASYLDVEIDSLPKSQRIRLD